MRYRCGQWVRDEICTWWVKPLPTPYRAMRATETPPSRCRPLVRERVENTAGELRCRVTKMMEILETLFLLFSYILQSTAPKVPFRDSNYFQNKKTQILRCGGYRMLENRFERTRKSRCGFSREPHSSFSGHQSCRRR